MTEKLTTIEQELFKLTEISRINQEQQTKLSESVEKIVSVIPELMINMKRMDSFSARMISAKEDIHSINLKIAVIEEKQNRLEKLTYGTLAIAVGALISGVLNKVISV